MKRLFLVVLAIGIFCSLGIFLVSAEGNTVHLSSLSEEECREILLDYGITIPKELSDIKVKSVFAALEENPYRIVVINWSILSNLYEDIRMVVKDYYGLPDTASSDVQSRAANYTLQYSTYHDDWSSSMLNYNCYAYAIGRTDDAYNPGDFSDGAYHHLESVELLAITVKADLHCDLGYSCVKIQDNRPASTTGWTNVIAVRKDTTLDYEENGVSFNDYHFAKLVGNSWLHKPGNTAVLEFNNAPSNSVLWWNEAYLPLYGYMEGEISYDSTIKYLLYKTNHGSATTRRSTGEHYHKGAYHWFKYEIVCTDCGDAINTEWVSRACSGPPCLVQQMKIFKEQEAS